MPRNGSTGLFLLDPIKRNDQHWCELIAGSCQNTFFVSPPKRSKGVGSSTMVQPSNSLEIWV